MTDLARLFLAVWAPDDVVEMLCELPRKDQRGVRFVPPENWHATLRFLGDADPDHVVEAMNRAVLPPSVGRVGPAIDMLGTHSVMAPVAGLDDLAAAVVDATHGIGTLDPCPMYTGHITVARVKRGTIVRKVVGMLCSADFAVTEVALVESRLRHRIGVHHARDLARPSRLTRSKTHAFVVGYGPQMREGEVLVITGPPGAGKSTVAGALAARLDRAVLVRGDDILGCVVSGFVEPWLPAADGQNRAALAATAATAREYAAGDYAVIVDAVLGPWHLDAFLLTLGMPCRYVVLRPTAPRPCNELSGVTRARSPTSNPLNSCGTSSPIWATLTGTSSTPADSESTTPSMQCCRQPRNSCSAPRLIEPGWAHGSRLVCHARHECTSDAPTWARRHAAPRAAPLAARRRATRECRHRRKSQHLRPWMPWIKFEPLTPAERVGLIEDWTRKWEDGGDAVYGVFLDGEVVGGAGLHHRQGPASLDIGYWIHVDHLRKGFATELTAALTSTALDVDGVDVVHVQTDEANEASAAVPAKLGFTRAQVITCAPEAPAESGQLIDWTVTADAWARRASN